MAHFSNPTLQRYLHIGLHAAIWMALTAYIISGDADLQWGVFASKTNTLAVPVLYGMCFNALVFYGNACWLMPRFLHTRRRYFWMAAVGILVISVVETAIDVQYALHQPVILEQIQAEFQPQIEGPWLPTYATGLLAVLEFFPGLAVHLVYWALSLGYRLYIDRNAQERTREILLREKMSAELNYLRAQINPHFLFNGINSIYHLIDQDTEQAKDVLLKFSGLLRYQLYECSGDSIALDKELDYLDNYIALEKIRKGADAQVEYTLSAGEVSWKIAPLLLTPLIENAFKYLSAHADSRLNRLTIAVSVENGLLELDITNTVQPELRSPERAGGLGLANVRQRLALLYPGQHRLEVDDRGATYHLNLHVQLHHA